MWPIRKESDILKIVFFYNRIDTYLSCITNQLL